jgi:hypothetical protein
MACQKILQLPIAVKIADGISGIGRAIAWKIHTSANVLHSL